MTALVCIPYFGTAEYVERAVRSVLAQTHDDLACVVIGDGEDPPIGHIRDSRLVVHSYATNRGVYFAQDVAIWASPFEWYAPMGSDDWLDPDHLERALSHGQDVACGALWAHGDGPGYCGPENDGHTACRGVLVKKAYEVGIYRTETYRRIGGHNPAERMGQDSLTLRVMRIVGEVSATKVPTYNRLFRQGSLSTHPDTNRDAPARIAMRMRNRDIVLRCMKLQTPERIRAYRDSLIPAVLKDALALEVEALRAKFGVQAVAA